MANWQLWEQSYMNVTIREDGDETEMEGANKFGLDQKFPNYERFWRRHVVPATNRPADIDLRRFIDPTVAKVAATSHGVFCDLVAAERALVRVSAGDYGGARWELCQEILKKGGDAMQKFDSLQRQHIEKGLATRIGRTLSVWTKRLSTLTGNLVTTGFLAIGTS